MNIKYQSVRNLRADIPGLGEVNFTIDGQGEMWLRIKASYEEAIEVTSVSAIKGLQDFLNRAMELKAPGA